MSSSHEAGAIEAGGHKVLTIPQTDGKISAEKVEEVLNTFKEDGNRDHMVMPGMVYISQPTEYGTLYNRQELEALSKVCHSNGIPLYLDGARLAYALACSANDVTLEDIAACCDAFISEEQNAVHCLERQWYFRSQDLFRISLPL